MKPEHGDRKRFNAIHAANDRTYTLPAHSGLLYSHSALRHLIFHLYHMEQISSQANVKSIIISQCCSFLLPTHTDLLLGRLRTNSNVRCCESVSQLFLFPQLFLFVSLIFFSFFYSIIGMLL